jgi:hypothetical protein
MIKFQPGHLKFKLLHASVPLSVSATCNRAGNFNASFLNRKRSRYQHIFRSSILKNLNNVISRQSYPHLSGRHLNAVMPVENCCQPWRRLLSIADIGYIEAIKKLAFNQTVINTGGISVTQTTSQIRHP